MSTILGVLGVNAEDQVQLNAIAVELETQQAMRMETERKLRSALTSILLRGSEPTSTAPEPTSTAPEPTSTAPARGAYGREPHPVRQFVLDLVSSNDQIWTVQEVFDRTRAANFDLPRTVIVSTLQKLYERRRIARGYGTSAYCKPDSKYAVCMHGARSIKQTRNYGLLTSLRLILQQEGGMELARLVRRMYLLGYKDTATVRLRTTVRKRLLFLMRQNLVTYGADGLYRWNYGTAA